MDFFIVIDTVDGVELMHRRGLRPNTGNSGSGSGSDAPGADDSEQSQLILIALRRYQ
jgi:hypothetical protein